jgi:ribosomal-protein-alanine acetyltransferase
VKAEAVRSPLSQLAVTDMRREHLTAVMQLQARVSPRGWSRALFAAELARPGDRCYLVALDRLPEHAAHPDVADGSGSAELVGYAGLALQADEGHITTVGVDPDHHRRKVATRLVAQLLWRARAMGAAAGVLEVRASNTGAQALYRQFGFAPVGVRPRYYAETGEDALVMWAHELQGQDFASRLGAQAGRLDEPGGASGLADVGVPRVRGSLRLPDSPAPDSSGSSAPGSSAADAPRQGS